MPELRELTTAEEWDRAVPILRQLWEHQCESFVRSWREDEDYRLFGWIEQGRPSHGSGDGTDETDDGGAPGRDGGGAPGRDGGGAEGEDDGAPPDGTLLAVAGVYVQTVLHHERGVWVHDFVVDEAHRGEGHGEALLRALESWGAARDCEHVALACVADNDAAAFYEHAGMDAFGTVYEIDL